MEAPEKIYIHEASAPEMTDKLPYYIEYIRKDAFIEKAIEWLKENIYKHVYKQGDNLGFPTAEFLKDFKKYMEL